MLKIKLFRIGKKGQPKYRIVIAEARSKRGGKYVELLGSYDPKTDPHKIVLDQSKYEAWLKKGAQATATVKSLYEEVKKASK
jgi:small subunit ribosomal protein S16